MRKLWSKLNIVSIIAILVVAIIILLLFKTIFLRDNASPVQTGTDNSNQSSGGGIDEPPGLVDIDPLNEVDTVTKSIKLVDLMPYYSEAFNVVYDYGDDSFTVYLNPASVVTQEDVMKWFKSFPEVKRPDLLNVVFAPRTSQGPPVTVR